MFLVDVCTEQLLICLILCEQPEETSTTQYGVGGTSPSRTPGPRGRTSSSVGPMRTRPADRKHDTSPYGSTIYLRYINSKNLSVLLTTVRFNISPQNKLK
ncbi:hypothetical protein EVAR_18456_1 [Eumeta japonica]|uniref:Uncharacterized protein n=1 Tax=Eumeta variegata TaxID=151549 RepID=A0A4C1V0X7_EUMVA|nr:hypothetical protein EVAR_18456_1 [Eumeta japonica]